MTERRPAWLRPFALVTGTISSAPLDLPSRMDAVYRNLVRLGWQVAVRSIGTDFAGPWGLPVPKDQPLEIYIHRTDRPYTAAEAQAALANVLSQLELRYSAAGAWLGEVMQEVIVPTARDVKQAAKSSAPWLLGAALLAGVVLLSRR